MSELWEEPEPLPRFWWFRNLLASLAFWKSPEKSAREKARAEFEAMPIGRRDTHIVFTKVGHVEHTETHVTEDFIR